MTSAWHERSVKMQAEIEALYKKEGSLDPSKLVSWAKKHPKSELYKSFEWDDMKAGHEYRLWQARQLIKTYVVVKPVDDKPIRFVSVPILRHDKSGDGSYVPASEVLEDEDYRDSVLDETKKKLRSLRDSNRIFTPELESVWRAIDKLPE